MKSPDLMSSDSFNKKSVEPVKSFQFLQLTGVDSFVYENLSNNGSISESNFSLAS